tara:strand:+ start:828 stop:1712 length:885 start_codon:yes stop_codon:yes gene_type:complete
MKYTNKHNIPIEIIRAVENDSYSKGDSVKSITGLLQPPQISILNEEHSDKITQDISERIWILLGQSVHSILERANESELDTLTEERMYATVYGWRISGQTDSISLEDNTLKDYKVTSAWTVMNALKDEKPEWAQQLNCYGWLAKQSGKTIDQLNIIAISRDWSKFQYERSGGDYPPAPVTVINIPMWTDEEQQNFIEERVSLHQDAEAEFLISGTLPPCSDEERWKKEDTYRVVKAGRKSALRVLDSQKKADKYMSGHKDEKNLSVELALGKSVRCESYCPVADFCKQYQEEKL